MKKVKVFLITLLAAVMTLGSFSIVHADDDDIRPAAVKITTPKKTVFAGSVFELKARMTPAKADDDFLYWSIVGTKGIVQLEKDRTDDDIKIKALRAGTTKVRCQIRGTQKYSIATITVKKPTYAFSRVGSATKTVEVGDDFELRVKRSGGLSDNDLKWSIKNRNIVRFDAPCPVFPFRRRLRYLCFRTGSEQTLRLLRCRRTEDLIQLPCGLCTPFPA